MEAQKFVVWTRSGLSVLAVALVFAAAFIIRCEPVENHAFTTLTVYISNFLVILCLAWLSFRHRISMWTLFSGLVSLVIIKYFLLTSSNHVVLFISNIVLGGIYGLSILLLGSVLSFSSLKSVRRLILLGVMGAVLLFPLFHSQSIFDERYMQKLLFCLIPVVMLIFMLLEKRTNQPFLPAAESLKKYGTTEKPWRAILLTQRKSNLITMVMTIPFFFCLGIFRGYSLEKGFSIISSDVIMYSVAALILALYIANRIERTNTWFNMICFAIGGVYMAIIFSILVVADFPPYLFGIMRAGIIILQIWVLSLLSEASLEESLSPIFLYGALALVYLLPHILGDLVASLLRGSEAYVAPILVGGALMTIAIAAGTVIVLLIKGKSFDMAELALANSGSTLGTDAASREQEASALKAEHYAVFCRDYGLSEKESEVIHLYSQGRSVPYISAKLFISESTVRTHLQRAYLKLDIHSKQELLDAIDRIPTRAAGNGES